MKMLKVLIFWAVSLTVLVLFSTKLYVDNTASFDTIATFLSITLGFSITALSIIATSPFSKTLYSREVRGDNSRTQLHELVGQFRVASIVFAAAIAFILVFKYAETIPSPCFSVGSCSISLRQVGSGLIWYQTALSFIVFCRLLWTFSHFVTKSAANS